MLFLQAERGYAVCVYALSAMRSLDCSLVRRLLGNFVPDSRKRTRDLFHLPELNGAVICCV